MSDWQFRIASEAAFAADLNTFCAANGYAPLSPDGSTVASCVFEGVARFDFDGPFSMTSGLHINARAMVLGDADPVFAGQVTAALTAQLAAWFGATGTPFPACPGLAVFTNPQLVAPQIGGQVWQRTPGDTILISPSPTYPARVWA